MTTLMLKIVQLPLGVSLIIILALSAAVPWLAVLLVRRIWPHPAFKENNELVGFTYSVYGLIYGVLMAFSIVVGWERFSDTEQLVLREMTVLSQLWRDSVVARPFIRDDIQKHLLSYAQSVVDDEWPTMASQGQANPKTEKIYESLWAITYRFEPKTKIQQGYMDHFLGRMNELSNARRLRILQSQMKVHRGLWLVLLTGALPTMFYPLLFSNKHAWVQVVIMGCIMLIVLLCLLLTLHLEHPFSGVRSIQPEAFREFLDIFRQQSAVP